MELKQYIYVLKLTPQYWDEERWTEEARAIVGRHFERLQGMLEQGSLILAGKTSNLDETTFGVVIFTAASDEAAKEIMLSDPAVAGGVMTAELQPFRVALRSCSQ